MEEPISNSLRVTFLVHMIFALILGAMMLLIPGRTLVWVGWVPNNVDVQVEGVSVGGLAFVDPIIMRMLGAALLALGFASFLGWRASRREQVKLLVQMELVFCVLGVLAILAGFFNIYTYRPMPVFGWVIAVILAAFAVAWGLALRR